MALQPTNAGINYQQRIAAQFLALMLTDSYLDSWLPGSNGNIESIRFESNDEIDDLVFENNLGDIYYIQAKRSLSLSDRPDSQFYKVAFQFVGEYLTGINKGKYYLAVSSDSSGTINNRLRRLLNNVRRNRKIENLCLNKSDNDILNTFFSSIRLAYKNRTDAEIDLATLLCLCERIYIVVFDIEDGLSGEMACKMLLASFNSKQYDFLWRSLIVDSLDFATNRSIATRSYIQDKYSCSSMLKKKEKFFIPALDGEAQIGYDVVLGRSHQLLEFIKKDSDNLQQFSEDSLMLLQLYRFDETGKKQISQFYPDNRLIMPGEIEVEVIHRCSSITGMERYLETCRPEGTSIISMLGHGDGQEDHFPEAQLHKKWVTEQLTKETNLYCIHCEEPIAGKESYMLEIDNVAESLKIGCAHVECTRPVDRVLGLVKGPVFDGYSYLKSFDYAFWSKAKGQRLLEQLKAMGIHNSHILWNNDIQSAMKGRYCIKANLENGDNTYVTQRGYVVRGAHAYIESQVDLHNLLLNQLTEDPFGYTSFSNAYGNYSSLVDKLEVGEEFRQCISFECVPFTSTIHELFDVEGDYYTPLVYLTVKDSIAVLDGYIFMLSSPLDLQKYLNNWKEKMGYDLGGDYCVVTVKNDAEFDRFMQEATDVSIKIVVDPWFGNHADLVRGYFIDSYDMEIQQGLDKRLVEGPLE
ncbi:hypothetical protein [Lacrimispora sp.]|uniref:hypothetical protein n=1 Tax=Lacrimispora sp. TaxID=2719234 RepID=UPI0028B044A5|nr:hypothetical protein [Lacrimispora sp.]